MLLISRSVTIAVLCVVATVATADTAVIPTVVGTIGINGLGSQSLWGELQVSNRSSDFGFPLQRAFLVFPSATIPADFESCVLRLNATSPAAASPIYVSVIPSGSDIYMDHFDYDFSAPWHMCEPLNVPGPGLVTVDVTECVRAARQSTPEYFIVRLALRLYGGGTYSASFSSLSQFQSPPRTEPEPQLAFSGPVPTESSTMSSIKAIFR